MKILVLLLCICSLIGCSNNQEISTTSTELIKNTKNGTHVSSPQYNSRLKSQVVQQGEVLEDGSKVIQKIQVKYSPSNSLDLLALLKYDIKKNNNYLYIKSNMTDKQIMIFDDKIDLLQDENFIRANLHFDLHSYRILSITLDKSICWINLEDLIEPKKFPKEIDAIYEHYPRLPKIEKGAIGRVVIDNEDREYIELAADDAREIIDVYSGITSNMFFDNHAKEARTYMANQSIYIIIDDDVHQYTPLFCTGTMVDYGIYSFDSKKVYEIMQKYVKLHWYNEDEYTRQNE